MCIRDRPTWLVVALAFQRVVLLSAVALHVMAVIAFTHAICDAQAEKNVPDVAMIDARKLDYDECIADARGGGIGWRALSTATVTHALLQLVFFALSRWIHAPTGRSWCCTCATWRSFLYQNFNAVVGVSKLVSVVLLLVVYFIHYVQLEERAEALNLEGVVGFAWMQDTKIDYFHVIAFIYAVGWTPPLLQLPLPLPGYSDCWGGVAPQLSLIHI